jgi:ribosomal 50S subunit-recycling heat shock protein
MSVQTIKIDDDLQSALKKQQRKIDVAQEKEKADPEEKKDESHVTETNENKRRRINSIT